MLYISLGSLGETRVTKAVITEEGTSHKEINVHTYVSIYIIICMYAYTYTQVYVARRLISRPRPFMLLC